MFPGLLKVSRLFMLPCTHSWWGTVIQWWGNFKLVWICWLALWPVVFFCHDLVNATLLSQPPLNKGQNLVTILCSLCPCTHTWATATLLGLIFHCFNADSADKSRSPPETQLSCVHRRCQCHQCMNNTCPCSGIVLRLGRMKPTNQWLPASVADPLSLAGHPIGLCYKRAQALNPEASVCLCVLQGCRRESGRRGPGPPWHAAVQEGGCPLQTLLVATSPECRRPAQQPGASSRACMQALVLSHALITS